VLISPSRIAELNFTLRLSLAFAAVIKRHPRGLTLAIVAIVIPVATAHIENVLGAHLRDLDALSLNVRDAAFSGLRIAPKPRVALHAGKSTARLAHADGADRSWRNKSDTQCNKNRDNIPSYTMSHFQLRVFAFYRRGGVFGDHQGHGQG
jgi:hypothetical protein